MVERVLRRHGLEYVVEVNKHAKIKVRHGERKETIVCGMSTSDKCAIRNLYSTVRRLLIGMGVEWTESKDLLFN